MAHKPTSSRKPASVVEDVRDDLKSAGVRIAYNALTSVCQDGKAPAQARATAGVALLRAAGMLDKHESEADKEIHDMTPDERLAFWRKMRDEELREGEDVEGGSDIFD